MLNSRNRIHRPGRASTLMLLFLCPLTGLAADSVPTGDVNAVLGLRDSSVQQLSLIELPDGQLDLTVTLDDRVSRFHFSEHSVRALDYQLLEQAPDGTLVEIPAGPINTYRGTDAGWLGTKAALSIEDDGFRVVIRAQDGEQWWIEPLQGRVRGAMFDDYAVYRGEDVITPEGFCGVKDEHVLPLPDLDAPAPVGEGRIVLSAQFVADTDFEFFQNYGSATAVENRINALVNSINLQYENQVEIINELQGIIVRSNSSDPYSSNSIETRLDQVQAVWNSTNTPPHDLVQLFSGASFTGSTIGLAYLGAVCSSAEYSVVESDCCGAFACATDLSAHEIGHNWNAGHCNCPSNTMNPSLVCANNFTAASISSITAYRNAIASCLDSVEGACCTSNDACLVVSEALCNNAGGEFLGEGTDCEGNPCVEPVLGACCLASGTCVDDVTSDTCTTAGGTWEGEDTDCGDVTCDQPDPSGACCLAGGSCTTLTSPECSTAGGSYQGNDTDCDFVDCEETDVVEIVHAIVGSGKASISQPNWTVDVYASVGEGFRVDAVAGNSVQQKMITSSSGFYQDEFGGPTSMAINPAFYEFAPNLEWDSRVTIGAIDQTGNPYDENNLQSVGIDWGVFESGGDLSVGDGTWFILPDDGQGEARLFTGQDCTQRYGVLLARLTALELDSTLMFEALVQGRDSGGNTWQDVVNYSFAYEAIEDCNDNLVPDNCDIANGTSQDSNGNGIPDECDSECDGDADGDGDADVDDLLMVLGAFGTAGPEGDMDNDGDVDVDDILQVLSVYGEC